MKAKPQSTTRQMNHSRRRCSRRTRQLMLAAGLLMSGCGGVAQQADAQRLADAQRERDALRVAYEAQQLRLKELSERIVALEDRVMLDVSPSRSSRGAGLWGRPQRGAQPRQLPVVKLSALSGRPSAQPATYSAAPPSAQLMRAERLERLGRAPEVEGVPTLTAQNVDQFKRKGAKRGAQTRAKRARAPYPAPQGSEGASSLGVVPVPPSPQGEKPSVARDQRRPSPLAGAALERGAALQEPAQERPESGPDSLGGPSEAPLTSLTASPQGTSRDPFSALLVSADAALKSRDWAEAKRSYEQVLSLAPTSSDRSKARLGIARALKGRGRHREAIEALRALIQADPSGALVPSALWEIGDIQLASGQTAQGKATLTRLKSLYPNTSAARRAERVLP